MYEWVIPLDKNEDRQLPIGHAKLRNTSPQQAGKSFTKLGYMHHGA